MDTLLIRLMDWSVMLVDRIGYGGVLFLMFIESSFIPFPSELVMPQAGILAAEGRMNAGIAVLMGVLGSLLGAILNYYLALGLGRPFFEKFGKWLFCPPETFAKAERFFQRHGEIGTFTGRLIPLIRQWISLPAGLARMRMARFLFYTGLGSGLWVIILAAIGFIAGRNRSLIEKYSHQATIICLAGGAAVVAVYVWMHRRRKAAAATGAGGLKEGGV